MTCVMDADAGTCNVQGATHMAVEMYRMYMDERLLAQLDWAACYVYFETLLEENLLGESPQAAFRNIASSPPMLGEHFLVFDAFCLQWSGPRPSQPQTPCHNTGNDRGNCVGSLSVLWQSV